MLKLPFTISPKKVETHKVGDAEIGELEVRRLNDLSPNERIWISEQMKNYPDLRTEAIKIARAIASKSGKKLLETYEALTSGEIEALGDFLEEFVLFQKMNEETSRKRRIVMATAIIRFRVMPEWEIENTGDANLIHPKLVTALADFATKEESGWAEPETAPVTEEELKKPELVAA